MAALRFVLALPLVFAPSLLACDSGNDNAADAHDDAADTHGDTAGDTHGDTAADSHDQGDCFEVDDDDYAIGLSKSGELVAVQLTAFTPAPPAMGDNTWTVRVVDSAGQPVADAGITAVTPFMPAHGHGTPVAAEVAPSEVAGDFEITPINLFMAGLWQITLDIDVGDGTTDQVVFAACVE